MNLPAPCPECAPFGGAWMATENGMRRCNCERGQILAKPAEKRQALPPIINETNASLYAEMLAGGMKFYPSEAGARALIAGEIAAICNSDAEARWLVLEMHRRYDGNDWPGITEMRALHCMRNEPRDGIMAISAAIEEQQEREYVSSLAVGPAPMKQLGAGEPVSASPSISTTIGDLARAKDLNRKIKGLPPGKVEEIPVVRMTEANRITPAMIAVAEREYREKIAREAVGLEGPVGVKA